MNDHDHCAAAATEHLPVPTASDALSVLERISATPGLDPATLRQLWELQKDVRAEGARIAYFDSLARVKANLPQIDKHGKIIVKGTLRSKYARLEDIDLAIQPILAEEGMAFSFNSKSSDGGKIFVISCRLSHRQGHSETNEIVLPMDASDFRSNVQSIGSTISYAKRQLIKMHLNLIERDEDDDGHGGQGFVTDDQAKDLECKLQEVGGDRLRFLNMFGIDSFSKLPLRQYSEALNAIDTKRRANEKEKEKNSAQSKPTV